VPSRSIVCKSQISKFPNHQISKSRSGISLLEVLVSIFILSVGLLGVAALIPLGKLAMTETNKSDRVGACGRAALREVRIRRALDYRFWYNDTPAPGNPNYAFAIDPLGVLKIGSNALGPLPRVNVRVSTGSLTYLSEAQADAVFRWRDDLVFVQADASTAPSNGERPMPVPNATAQQSEGNFSWFLTVCPSPSDMAVVPVALRRDYTVSVVVCHKREFIPAAEQTWGINNLTGFGPGGGTIQVNLNGRILGDIIKYDQWVLLVGTNTGGQPWVAKWYRVVGVGRDYLSLVGPDWDADTFPAAQTQLVSVEGVAGVYTTAVHLDDDLIWNK
jgi:type II secretory pathway pseudopilin PulG